MSTRSPQNKRNQDKLQGSMTGMARKSAASAKPARPAAASVRVVSSSAKAQRAARERGEDLSNLTREEKRARRQEQRMAEDRIYQASAILLKEDETYAGYRKIWWAMLGIGIGGLIVSVILMAVRSQGGAAGDMQLPEMIAMAVGYIAVIAGFIFDFVKIRPIRNKCRFAAEHMPESKLAGVLARGAAAASAKAGK